MPNKKKIAIIATALLATGVSTFLGTRAIAESVSYKPQSVVEDSETLGNAREISDLVVDFEAHRDSELDFERDPFTPYEPEVEEVVVETYKSTLWPSRMVIYSTITGDDDSRVAFRCRNPLDGKPIKGRYYSVGDTLPGTDITVARIGKEGMVLEMADGSEKVFPYRN